MLMERRNISGKKIDYLVPESEFVYSGLPRINGMPYWENMETTCWGHHPPDFCRFDKMINYPAHLQEPQIAIQGTFGTGKSQLLNLIVMLKLAQGYKGLAFIDRHVEIRNIVPYGYYKKKSSSKCTAFDITIWSPQDYKFDDIWGIMKRSNVEYRIQDNGFQEAKEIVEKLDETPYGVQAVYYDCYDRAGRIKLWIDIMEGVQRLRNSREEDCHPVVFFMHELSEVLPMLPEGSSFLLAQQAADLFLDFRKDDICTVAAYQMGSEVYYRFSFKWTFICQKRPTLKRILAAMEEPARLFAPPDVNISRDGYWMHHRFGALQEVRDHYRLIPSRNKLTYGSDNTKENETMRDLRQTLGRAYEYINEELGIAQRKMSSDLSQTRNFIRYQLETAKSGGGLLGSNPQ